MASFQVVLQPLSELCIQLNVSRDVVKVGIDSVDTFLKPGISVLRRHAVFYWAES